MPYTAESATSPRSEMDITTVFGTVVPGSNPGGGTKERSEFCVDRRATARGGVAQIFSRKLCVTTKDICIIGGSTKWTDSVRIES